MSSPYINHFLQPDTLIPDLSNPQGWNRYSYVTNRPVNFNDPTGHRPCGDGEVIACETGFLNNPVKHLNKGCGGLGQKRCTGELPTYGDGLVGPPEPELTIGPRPEDARSFGDDMRDIGYWIKGGKFVHDLIVFIGNYGTPIYRQAKGFGNWGPFLEGGAGALLQGAKDYDNPSFTLSQKIVRAVIVGGEDGLTEIASEYVSVWTAGKGFVGGAAIGEAVCGPGCALGGGLIGAGAGYVGGNVTTNVAGNAFWSWANKTALPGLFP